MATPASRRGSSRYQSESPESQTRPSHETRPDDTWEELRRDLDDDLADFYPGMPNSAIDECIRFTIHEAKKSLLRGNYLDLPPRDRAKFVLRKFLRSMWIVDSIDFDHPLPPWKRDPNWQERLEAEWDSAEDKMQEWADWKPTPRDSTEPSSRRSRSPSTEDSRDQSSRDSRGPSWQRDETEGRTPDDRHRNGGQDSLPLCPWAMFQDMIEGEIERTYPGMPDFIRDECLNVMLDQAEEHGKRCPQLELPFPQRTGQVVKTYLRTTGTMDYFDLHDTLPPWSDPDFQYKVEIAEERIDIEMRQWSERQFAGNIRRIRHREDRYDPNWDTGSVCIKYESD